jgi:DtxR family transcriptional regulator, Mn-dependent transcriptional regulator
MLSRTPRVAWRTEAVENMLKHIYLINQEVDPVPTSMLASALCISAPSTTEMIKRLAVASGKENRPELLTHEPYKGVRLNAAGQQIALEVVRHHRLIELYLINHLKYSWDEVHEEADKLEHYISERLEARMADALGHPTLDPHGDPIPAIDGSIEGDNPARLALLVDCQLSSAVEVRRIIDQTSNVLRYLADLGIDIGTTVQVAGRSPLGDTMSIHIGDGQQQTISTHVARKIMVSF